MALKTCEISQDRQKHPGNYMSTATTRIQQIVKTTHNITLKS